MAPYESFIKFALSSRNPQLRASESARRDRQIVADEIEFRELRLLGKIRLVGVGHTDLASLDRQNRGCVLLYN
jgi:hypothetical protein